MPIYDYLCECGHGFDALRAIAKRDEPAECPQCKKPAPRVLSLPSPGGAPGEVWEYEYPHMVKPKFVRDRKGNRLKFDPNTMRKGRPGHG